MRVVFVSLLLLALGCKEEAEPGFELNARRIAELANATCSCSDSVSNQSCAESYQELLQASLVAQIEAGRVVVDGARWGDCIEQLLACDSTPRACDTVFAGTLAEDDECFSDSECAPGLRCEADDPEADDSCASVGRCVEIERIAHGKPCEMFDRCKEDDDICGVATSGDHEGENICRAPLDEGDACPLEQPGGQFLCKRGQGCVPSDDGVVCGDPLELGEACTFVEDELSGSAPCEEGFCDTASGECTPYDFPVGAELGEDCEMRADCLPGLVCLEDECARPLPNGSECDGEDQCVAHCADGRCAPAFIACEGQ